MSRSYGNIRVLVEMLLLLLFWVLVDILQGLRVLGFKGLGFKVRV